MKIILASGSPRRKELLTQINIPFMVSVSDVDETIEPHWTPAEMVMNLARKKAEAIAKENKDAIIIGADTTVTYNGQILEKPKDETEARAMLKQLSDNTHEVYTGVAIVSGKETTTFFERTEVTFYQLTEEEIQNYVASKEPMDKAGAYGIQGLGATLVKEIKGDYFNVVGLPIAALVRKLPK